MECTLTALADHKYSKATVEERATESDIGRRGGQVTRDHVNSTRCKILYLGRG